MFDMSETNKKLIDVEAILFAHVPVLQRYPILVRRLLVWG